MVGGIPKQALPTDSEQRDTKEIERQDFGQYELIAQLSPSPLGALWAARVASGPDEGRIVSVRRLLVSPPVTGAIAEKVHQAALVASTVRHPRIAAVLDVLRSDQEVAIVTEYVEGESLRALQRRAGLKNTPMPMGVALRIALDFLEGLSNATTAYGEALPASGRTASDLHHLVHGGLSPHGLLLACFGEPLLVDFGVAGALATIPVANQSPHLLAYRAPEQLDPRGVADERTDVFAGGILLWELLANRPLFGPSDWALAPSASDGAAPNATEGTAVVQARVLRLPIARLDALVRAGQRVPPPIAEVISQALRREPEARFPTLQQMHETLAERANRHVASREEVVECLHALARTSLEARRAALARAMGRGSVTSPPAVSGSPTIPPPPPAFKPAERLSAPGPSPRPTRAASSELEKGPPKKPPLPFRKGKNQG